MAVLYFLAFSLFNIYCSYKRMLPENGALIFMHNAG